MNSIKRSILMSAPVLALLASALMPAVAAASDSYYPYNDYYNPNCNWYGNNNCNTNYYPPRYTPPTYQQPIIISKYVPALPNTGFAPLSNSTLAFAVAFLVIVAAISLPYVRKAFTVVLS